MPIVQRCTHCGKVARVYGATVHCAKGGISGYTLKFRCTVCSRIGQRPSTPAETEFINAVGLSAAANKS